MNDDDSAGVSSDCQNSNTHTHTHKRQVSYRVFTRSSKRPALARVFWIHLLEVCWTFAGTCEHPMRLMRSVQCFVTLLTDGLLCRTATITRGLLCASEQRHQQHARLHDRHEMPVTTPADSQLRRTLPGTRPMSSRNARTYFPNIPSIASLRKPHGKIVAVSIEFMKLCIIFFAICSYESLFALNNFTLG